MRFFVLAEIVLLVLIVYAIVSQILLPAWRGTALFPWVRRERRIRDDIVEAAQEKREAELEQDLAAMLGPAGVEPATPWPRTGDAPATTDQQQEQKNV